MIGVESFEFELLEHDVREAITNTIITNTRSFLRFFSIHLLLVRPGYPPAELSLRRTSTPRIVYESVNLQELAGVHKRVYRSEEFVKRRCEKRFLSSLYGETPMRRVLYER